MTGDNNLRYPVYSPQNSVDKSEPRVYIHPWTIGTFPQKRPYNSNFDLRLHELDTSLRQTFRLFAFLVLL